MINPNLPPQNGIIAAVHRSFAITALAALLPCSALAQNDSTDNLLFRMAHLEGAKGNCILVQTDGDFHVEESRGNSTRIFEGTLAPDRTAALRALLNSDRFQQLLPEAVSSSLLPTGLDETLISVPRDGRWMNLRFLAGLGSDRNRELLDQFEKWERVALKNSRKKLREESSRKNCLPAGPIELKPGRN